ncbi:hypothetical protein GGR54DRAFT_640600 [Hypoxylon sp. NC1633]|nr:hypothetical protein GGR54DRAFT_640600 [Hypoxylon sp. NC1633]
MSLSPEQIEYFQEHASDDLSPSLIVSSAVGLVLAYIFVGLRIWARKAGKIPFGHDDWLIIVALAPLSTYAIVAWIQTTFGEGRHILFVTNRAGFVQAYITCIVAYALCVVLTKISVLCFYCRIFFPIRKLFYISWAIGILTVAYNLALIFVSAFECIPLSSLWTGEPGKCIRTLQVHAILGIVNIVTDVGILALPIRPVLLLRLTLTQRIQVCGIFLLGGVVCVFSIVRVVALSGYPEVDPSYNLVWSGVWSFCEIAIGIVAACLPTLAILVTKLKLSKLSTSVMRLVSFISHTSRSGSGSNTKASGHSVRETKSDDNDYVHLSEWSLARGQSGDSRDAIYQGNGYVSPFVSSSRTEHGEGSEDHPSGIVVKNEVVQTFH